MNANRKAGHAPRVRALAEEIVTLQGPCLGCKGCDGLCQALIEAMTVPDTVLRGRA